MLIKPKWYWKRGLHDARILSAESLDLSYEYTVEKSYYNCFAFKLNGEDAMFEQDITEIRLYNFKILSSPFDISELQMGWWIADELSKNNGWYRLNLEYENKKCKPRKISISFETAEVIRK